MWETFQHRLVATGNHGIDKPSGMVMVESVDVSGWETRIIANTTHQESQPGTLIMKLC